MQKINISTKKYSNIFVLVDDEDFKHLNQWKWFVSHNGYAKRNKPNSWGKPRAFFYMHRIINNTPEGLFTDHINRNKLDNRRENLRTVNKQQNGRNVGLKKNNKSGITGVYYAQSRNKWVANIKINNKTIFLGRYSEIQQAILARRRREKLLYK